MQQSKLFILLFFLSFLNVNAQQISDDFEGNGNINTWFGDNCGMVTNFLNPFSTGINTSSTVLRYSDTGGLFANVRFDATSNFDMLNHRVFVLKVYVPSTGINGNQPNQISLKLQNGQLNEPWASQSEIIKPLLLNQWQIVTFDFGQDSFINLNSNSPDPIYRNDFNRVVLQINGENNSNQVLAFIDDFVYDISGIGVEIPVFDHLVWSDEFNGSGAINSEKWFHQTQLPNGGSWYNGEIQHYTNRIQNSFVSNGKLTIAAKKEIFSDQGHTKQFTSARLNSKFAFKKGRVVVRAKLPTGIGTWPAIWMLGKNIIEPGGFWTSQHGTVGWPTCGEIDIMEHWGTNQNFVQSAMHTPSSFGNTVNHGGQIIPTASSAFHDYELIWTDENMIFKVDGVIHYIYNPPIKNAQTWPFNADQYLLLNIAIQPSIASNFTQSNMEIDYVRVYQQAPLSLPDMDSKNSLLLYPNPSRDELTIKIQDEWIGRQAVIYSVLGQKISNLILVNNKNIIRITDFEKGIYFLSIDNHTFKFIKE